MRVVSLGPDPNGVEGLSKRTEVEKENLSLIGGVSVYTGTLRGRILESSRG